MSALVLALERNVGFPVQHSVVIEILQNQKFFRQAKGTGSTAFLVWQCSLHHFPSDARVWA